MSFDDRLSFAIALVLFVIADVVAIVSPATWWFLLPAFFGGMYAYDFARDWLALQWQLTRSRSDAWVERVYDRLR